MSNLLSVKETAEYLGLSTRTVYQMIRDNRLPAFRVGSQWRVRASDLDHMFAPSNIVRGDS
ncbi:helix-turn-helix domain-containing protein [Nocardioides nanhaiensis]|uniref:helix-turn-helix domain-containing protein n=1 Tax=Nocardioides nanhaiensis TaxID=1476871 RepID=UPI003CD0A682